jgi:hypothetical protein
MELDTLQPGRAMDALVAEKVFGKDVNRANETCRAAGDRWGIWEPLPRYSTGRWASNILAARLKDAGVAVAGLDPPALCRLALQKVAEASIP